MYALQSDIIKYPMNQMKKIFQPVTEQMMMIRHLFTCIFST